MLWYSVEAPQQQRNFCIEIRKYLYFLVEKKKHLTKSCSHIVKTLIIKYGIYANIFAEKMFAKATHIFSAKITVN